MWKASSLSTALLVLIAVIPAGASSQGYVYDNGYFYYVDGTVTLQRASSPETELGEPNVPVLPGDRIWTAAGAFTEIRLADAAKLRLGESTKIDVVTLGSQPSISLWNGSVIVRTEANQPSVRVDTPAGSFYAQSNGTYRIDLHDASTMTVSATTGVAELASDGGSVLVRAGQRSVLTAGSAPSEPFAFDTASWDPFDTWSHERDGRTSHARSVPLAELPTEVHHYVDDLDEHGSWRQNSEYGSVWYPTVAAGWAPYRHGRWGYTSYGHTWVSYEPWGWAPYHYGRWGYDRYGWHWIPGRYWGPAWVSFAVGPTWVGWSPLGYYGGSVFAYNHVYYDYNYYRHERNRYYRGRAVPRHVYEHGAGWNYSRKDQFRSRKARLRASDVRGSAGRARVYDDGRVLDRGLNAHLAQQNRAPAAAPFRGRNAFNRTRARSAVVRGNSLGAGSQPSRRTEAGTNTAARARSRVFRSGASSTTRALDSAGFASGINRDTRARTRPNQTRGQARNRAMPTVNRDRATQSPANRSRARTRGRTFGAPSTTSPPQTRERNRQPRPTPTMRTAPSRNRPPVTRSRTTRPNRSGAATRTPQRNRQTYGTTQTPNSNRGGVTRAPNRSRPNNRVTRPSSTRPNRGATRAPSRSRPNNRVTRPSNTRPNRGATRAPSGSRPNRGVTRAPSRSRSGSRSGVGSSGSRGGARPSGAARRTRPRN